MARVLINHTKLENVALRGDGTKRELRRKAYKIRDEAKEVFRYQDKHSDSADDYMDSFYIEPQGDHYIVGNNAYTAFWVEFGSRIYPHGNKDLERIHVLGYAPLRTAVDIVSSYN